MDDLRKPFLFAALALMVLVVCIEVGAGLSLRGKPGGDAMSAFQGMSLPQSIRDALGSLGSPDQQAQQINSLASGSTHVPGSGIPFMAVLDGLVLFTVVLTVTPLILTDRVQGRVQGCATFILSILMILAAIGMIIAAIILLLLMIALLLAVPFGTIVYLAIYGFFDRGDASAVLSTLMLLKLAFAVCLFLAQQRFLQNRGLVLIVVSSLIANIVVSFLQGFVPIILVSITDDIAGIIVAACGCIWWILALIGAIPAILKAIRAQT